MFDKPPPPTPHFAIPVDQHIPQDYYPAPAIPDYSKGNGAGTYMGPTDDYFNGNLGGMPSIEVQQAMQADSTFDLNHGPAYPYGGLPDNNSMMALSLNPYMGSGSYGPGIQDFEAGQYRAQLGKQQMVHGIDRNPLASLSEDVQVKPNDEKQPQKSKSKPKPTRKNSSPYDKKTPKKAVGINISKKAVGINTPKKAVGNNTLKKAVGNQTAIKRSNRGAVQKTNVEPQATGGNKSIAAETGYIPIMNATGADYYSNNNNYNFGTEPSNTGLYFHANMAPPQPMPMASSPHDNNQGFSDMMAGHPTITPNMNNFVFDNPLQSQVQGHSDRFDSGFASSIQGSQSLEAMPNVDHRGNDHFDYGDFEPTAFNPAVYEQQLPGDNDLTADNFLD